MKACVLVFPGSNCDRDSYHALNVAAGFETQYRWHEETDLSGFDLIVVPGGFSYGDHLRSGAIARYAPVMKGVSEEASKGTPILGICNGFQILLEAGILPGAMLRNTQVSFRHQWVTLRTETTSTPFTSNIDRSCLLRMPIAHGEGNYFATKDITEQLQHNDQIVFRYCDSEGNATDSSNPNGSVSNIAGICNATRNVLGMMPHPERASELVLGGTDGSLLWGSLAEGL